MVRNQDLHFTLDVISLLQMCWTKCDPSLPFPLYTLAKAEDHLGFTKVFQCIMSFELATSYDSLGLP